jgi:hypothetical protein
MSSCQKKTFGVSGMGPITGLPSETKKNRERRATMNYEDIPYEKYTSNKMYILKNS